MHLRREKLSFSNHAHIPPLAKEDRRRASIIFFCCAFFRSTWDGLPSSACWSSRRSRSWSREPRVTRAVSQAVHRTRDAHVMTHITGILEVTVCATAVPEGPPRAWWMMPTAATELCVDLPKALR